MCVRWCHVAHVHRENGFGCKCAACTGSHDTTPNAVRTAMPQGTADVDARAVKLLTQGVPCHDGCVHEPPIAPPPPPAS
jgi:hypothetical protein